jgi:hypothetical protein
MPTSLNYLKSRDAIIMGMSIALLLETMREYLVASSYRKKNFHIKATEQVQLGTRQGY